MSKYNKESWYKKLGTMTYLKNDIPIRQVRFNDANRRRTILKIWLSEIKPNGKDCYQISIIFDDDLN